MKVIINRPKCLLALKGYQKGKLQDYLETTNLSEPEQWYSYIFCSDFSNRKVNGFAGIYIDFDKNTPNDLDVVANTTKSLENIIERMPFIGDFIPAESLREYGDEPVFEN